MPYATTDTHLDDDSRDTPSGVTAALYSIERTLLVVADGFTSPHAVMRPSLKRGPGGWTAVYGDVTGVGATPAAACKDFDKAWEGR